MRREFWEIEMQFTWVIKLSKVNGRHYLDSNQRKLGRKFRWEIYILRFCYIDLFLYFYDTMLYVAIWLFCYVYYVAMLLCCYADIFLCCYATILLCRCVAMSLCCYVAMLLCVYVVMLICYYADMLLYLSMLLCC